QPAEVAVVTGTVSHEISRHNPISVKATSYMGRRASSLRAESSQCLSTPRRARSLSQSRCGRSSPVEEGRHLLDTSVIPTPRHVRPVVSRRGKLPAYGRYGRYDHTPDKVEGLVRLLPGGGSGPL